MRLVLSVRKKCREERLAWCGWWPLFWGEGVGVFFNTVQYFQAGLHGGFQSVWMFLPCFGCWEKGEGVSSRVGCLSLALGVEKKARALVLSSDAWRGVSSRFGFSSLALVVEGKRRGRWAVVFVSFALNSVLDFSLRRTMSAMTALSPRCWGFFKKWGSNLIGSLRPRALRKSSASRV